MVEGLIWPFSLASGRIPPVDAFERVTIERFMVARVVAAAPRCGLVQLPA
jgi:hypothetical protein